MRLEGRTDGLMLFLDFIHDYANGSADPIEVLDSVPIPSDAVVLGVDATIDGQLVTARLTDVRLAEDAYEASQETRDFAVLVERANLGLCTVSLGRLEPGQRASVRLRTTTFVGVVAGRGRLALPTVAVYPEGSRLGAKAGVALRTEPTISAEYSVTLALALVGPAADACVSSPTHAVVRHGNAEAATVTLASPAVMDRDVVIVLDGLPGTDGVMVRRDHMTLAAAAITPVSVAWIDELVMTILVDTGGPLGLCLDDLEAFFSELEGGVEPGDRVTAIRVGRTSSTVVAKSDSGMPPRGLTDLLRLDSDVGDIPVGADIAPLVGAEGDLLFITDGTTRLAEAVCGFAAREKNRLFVLAVGTAPNEALLRPATRESGGDYAALAPGEPLEPALHQLLGALRTAPVQRRPMRWHNRTRPGADDERSEALLKRAELEIWRLGRRGVALASWRNQGQLQPLQDLTNSECGDEAFCCFHRTDLDGFACSAENIAALIESILETGARPIEEAVWLGEAALQQSSGKEAHLVLTPPMAPAGWRGVGLPSPVPPAAGRRRASPAIIAGVFAALLLASGGGWIALQPSHLSPSQTRSEPNDLPMRQADHRSPNQPGDAPGGIIEPWPSPLVAIEMAAAALAAVAVLMTWWFSRRRRR